MRSVSCSLILIPNNNIDGCCHKWLHLHRNHLSSKQNMTGWNAILVENKRGKPSLCQGVKVESAFLPCLVTPEETWSNSDVKNRSEEWHIRTILNRDTDGTTVLCVATAKLQVQCICYKVLTLPGFLSHSNASSISKYIAFLRQHGL